MSKPILLVPLILKNPSEYNLLTSKQIKFVRCCNATLTLLAHFYLQVFVSLVPTRVGWGGPTFLWFFSVENARRRNPATFIGFTFIVFSQVQCVLGSQVSVNSHVMLPAPAGCRFFFQGKTRLTGIAGKFQSWNKGICWPRSTVRKGDVGSCDSHPTKRVSLF